MSEIADTKDTINLTLTHEQIELIQEGLQVVSDELEDKRQQVNNLRQFIGYKILTTKREQETQNNG
jgi:hypothetical protein